MRFFFLFFLFFWQTQTAQKIREVYYFRRGITGHFFCSTLQFSVFITISEDQVREYLNRIYISSSGLLNYSHKC